jgi:phenylalanyl-tRNA synthetase beta chain
MRICDSWLREWIEHGLDADALAHRLTMLGLEVDSVTRLAGRMDRLVVGRVTDLRRHPNADKLSLCTVDVGAAEPLAIVCGARNVRAGGRYPTALVGAVLPGGMAIRAAKIRGEPSAGMLCSAAELGLDSGADGLLELDDDVVPGADAAELLRLDDAILEINVTPNRSDCFSIAGIAREVAAQMAAEARRPDAPPVQPLVEHRIGVVVDDPGDCPRFCGRVIRGLRRDARTPAWMKERLLRCGVRPIHPLVDVTNYVCLELGQPMHAYDLAKLAGSIRVRRGRAGESAALLDGRTVGVDGSVLLITDDSGPIGLAGIMGGASTAVSADTVDVFLEAAFFSPPAIAGRARRFGMNTDASLRFERGGDPRLPPVAIERATALIVAIAGGRPGPATDAVDADRLPGRMPVRLRRSRLAKVLGAAVPDGDVARILAKLGMTVVPAADGWSATPPPWRFDVELEEDLIEEVARVHGYENIQAAPGRAPARPRAVAESPDPVAVLADALVARGYQQAITFSFVEPRMSRLLGAGESGRLTLSNPISSDLAEMRQSLWPGLIGVARENLRRQRPRIRIFEIGSRFLDDAPDGHREEPCVALLATGARLPEQWGIEATATDFFDVKADVATLLAIAGRSGDARFARATHPALHPGRSARITLGERFVGWIGELHPAVQAELDMPGTVLVELSLAPLVERKRPAYAAISKFPSVRRDLAVVLRREITASDLLATIRKAAPATLREVIVFDIYTGRQIGDSEKSVAIGLILQDTSRTLTDEDADSILSDVRAALARELQARIRE